MENTCRPCVLSDTGLGVHAGKWVRDHNIHVLLFSPLASIDNADYSFVDCSTTINNLSGAVLSPHCSPQGDVVFNFYVKSTLVH